MRYYELIYKGVKKLNLYSIKNSKLDSEIILSRVLNITREKMILNLNEYANRNQILNFEKMIKVRSQKKPIAYLLNKKDFWKTQFYVNQSVLIPRPDTEVLVSSCLSLISQKDKLKILDIGTGSGCIIISILLERKHCTGIALDISKSALNTAKTNAKIQQLGNRISFFNSDIDNFFYGKYDLIVSNPPYIKKSDLKCLEKDVGFEPKQALDGGLDGLSEIRKVINKSSELIKRNGHLIIEIGFDQKNKVKQILRDKGFYIKKTVKDLSNHDRCIVSTKT